MWFIPRCALEEDDASQVRIDKIYEIIADCRYGIHDISRIELDEPSGFPRFNMPLELGVFLGAKKFGSEEQKGKKCLILDKEPYRYQHFMSDIAGQDIQDHSNTQEEIDQKPESRSELASHCIKTSDDSKRQHHLGTLPKIYTRFA